ncbi:hypothetical protein AB4Z21_32910, partial [Paenibacillus sp. MCAF20]
MGIVNWEHRQMNGEYTLLLDEKEIGRVLPFEDDRFEVNDTFESVRDGVVKWTRTFVYLGPVSESGKITMDFATSYEPQYYMIPSVTYNGNGWGSGLEPKGLQRDGQPWVFAWHRTAVAGATYSEGEGIAVSMFSEPPTDMQNYSCSLAAEPGCIIHRLIWPEEETPEVYISRDKYCDAFEAGRIFTPGESFETCAYLTIEAYTQPRVSWRKMLDEAWHIQKQLVQPRFNAESVWNLGMAYAKEGLWAEDGDFRGFAIGRKWDGEEWAQARHYEIG